MLLVIVTLKHWSLNMAYMLIFLLKNVSSFCICKSYSHFFSKNICELDTVLRTIIILTTNELVKLMMLWTTGSRSYGIHWSFTLLWSHCWQCKHTKSAGTFWWFFMFLCFLEIQRNREFYKNTDVRPPFTYASLIRQVSSQDWSTNSHALSTPRA